MRQGCPTSPGQWDGSAPNERGESRSYTASVVRPSDPLVSPDPRKPEVAARPAEVRFLFRNRFAGLTQIWEPCQCSVYRDEPEPSRRVRFHTDVQDTTCEGWQRLLALIDEAADDGREEFVPGAEMPEELWRQIVTLPSSIAKLSAVKRLTLYGSNLIAIPPEIGEMASLENFRPYTSRRLHWFPFEITRCAALRKSTVSTRNIYGNFKFRTPFPELPAAVPSGSTPIGCSVCNGPFRPTGAVQVWISLWVATDVLPLLVHACSEDCIRALPSPPRDYVDGPHKGGPELIQPEMQHQHLRPPDYGSNP